MVVNYGVIALTNEGHPLFKDQTDYLGDEVGRRTRKSKGVSNDPN